MNKCAFCQAPAEQCCSGCRNVHYCSRDHQKKHWRDHKSVCLCYKIEINERLGRHVVATRDIKEREIIIRENPLVLGPKIISFPTCLGCHKRINPYDYCLCDGCNWPMCNRKCSKSILHLNECMLMKEKGYRADINVESKSEIYAAIVPLRCLLLKLKNDKSFQTLMKLQSHFEERVNSPVYGLYKKIIVPFIRDKLKLDTDDEMILKICAVLDTNTFEIRKGSFIKIRGIFPLVAMASHDCIPNTRHTFVGDSSEIFLTATVPIKKGDIISATYTQTLWGTLSRRGHLKISKMFDCCCARCSDPTEMGTYIGSIYCTRCKISNKPNSPKMVSSNPLDTNAKWKCEKCDHTIPGRQMIGGNAAIRDELSRLDKSGPKQLEGFLDKYKDALHPTNSHMLEVKYALVQMYGNIDGYRIGELPLELIDRKIELCHELLEVADLLDPGSSRFRGLILYDLQAAMVMKTKCDYYNEMETEQAIQNTMTESIKMLTEAALILKTEPDFEEIIEEKMKNMSQELENS